MYFRCEFPAIILVLADVTQLLQALTTVEIRVDHLKASGPVTSRIECCATGQCACRSRLRACLYDHALQTCTDSQFQESAYLGGLSLTRTPSLLSLETHGNTTDLGVRVQIVYGPTDNQHLDVLGNYKLDLSALPRGPNADLAGWATFDLGTDGFLRVILQFKVYCSRFHHGPTCSTRCVPVTSQYDCDEAGRRVCRGAWTGELCDVGNPCLSFPCLNDGTCTIVGASHVCTCNSLYTGPDCSLGVDSCSASPCSVGSTCVDLVHNFTCLCPPGRTGRLCETAFTDCRAHGCANGGLCTQKPPRANFFCSCPIGFTGNRCLQELCAPGVCANGGTCRVTGRSSYVCDCSPGFSGQRCQITSSCDSSPCMNNARCFHGNSGDYICQCAGPYTGKNCENYNPCSTNPCGEHGHCVPQSNSDGFICQCHVHYTGNLCQVPNPCSSSPCLHAGTCTNRLSNYSCACAVGNFGPRCEHKDGCLSNPCLNGGTCGQIGVDSSHGFLCTCPQEFTGNTCEISVACSRSPCMHGGTCVPDRSSYFCHCNPGFSGTNCQDMTPCTSNPCRNGGSCYESLSTYVCVCPQGLTGPLCETRIQDHCTNNPCLNSGSCFQSGISLVCVCPTGYTGNRCENRILDTCSSRPCQNGGSCYSSTNSTVCVCPDEFHGDVCEIRNPCVPLTSSVCLNSTNCPGLAPDSSTPCGQHGVCQACTKGRPCSSEGRNYLCVCNPGYLGDKCETEDPCVVNKAACPAGRICVPIPALNTFICRCTGSNASSNDCGANDPCFPSPCHNNGVCTSLTSPPSAGGSTSPAYRCTCPEGFTGTTCQGLDACQGHSCLNNGTCFVDTSATSPSSQCRCPVGYVGSRCEGASCRARPCLNGGECLPSRGRSPGRAKSDSQDVTCSCPHGYRGDFCETALDCGDVSCMNGGSCEMDSRGERYCLCPTRFIGRFCETPLACDLVPCLNGGVCIPGMLTSHGGMSLPRCSCRAGFEGTRCEHASKRSPCEGAVCHNGGVCVDSGPDAGSCRCQMGWLGERCEMTGTNVVNACSPNVCTNGGSCLVLRGMPVCVCPMGVSGRLCEVNDPCSTHIVCVNGGTCVHRPLATPSVYCLCPIGYAGKSCQIRPRDPCTPSPCENSGRCTVDGGVKGYVCKCPRPFTGDNCEIKSRGSCLSSPCRNMATCIELPPHSFVCRCLPGWQGYHCHIWSGRSDVCSLGYCSGRGVCYLGQDEKPLCRCQQAFGDRCEFTCGKSQSGLVPHPAECTLYVSCVWGNPYVMQCPRHDLHFNPKLHTCDWHARAGCQPSTPSMDQQYTGILWRIRT